MSELLIALALKVAGLALIVPAFTFAWEGIRIARLSPLEWRLEFGASP